MSPAAGFQEVLDTWLRLRGWVSEITI